MPTSMHNQEVLLKILILGLFNDGFDYLHYQMVGNTKDTEGSSYGLLPWHWGKPQKV
jgi:hypothetical protein